MATEQIWANQVRIYRETAPRSGAPDGPVFTMPVGPAAVARRNDILGGRIDVFRNPQPLQSLHEYHEGRMAFTVGARFLGWLLTQHATDQAGVWTFDRNAPVPTFCMEVQTESDAFMFRGIAMREIQVGMTPPQLCTIDINFVALDRQPLDDLTSATDDLWSDVIPANVCAMAWTETTWGADPRVDNFYAGAFSVQVFLTRRELNPAMFMPDGRPERFTSAPWRVMADLTSVQSDLTLKGKKRADGRLAFYIGPPGASLDLVADRVSIFATNDPVKAVDFREESLAAEMHPDPAGSLLSVRDTSGLIP